MADKTSIEWTDATWNPLRGCSRVSEGCRHCYAETVAARFSEDFMPYEGLARRVGGEARWTGDVRLVEHMLDQPLRWKRPRRIFVNSMSDLFHEKVPDEWIDRIFAVMALAPHHQFQVLTKRSARMQKYLRDRMAPVRVAAAVLDIDLEVKIPGSVLLASLAPREREEDPEMMRWPLQNVWLGVSVEDQRSANERVPDLISSPAAKRFISAEPLLGPVSLTSIPYGDGELNAFLSPDWVDEVEQWRGSSDTWEEDFLDWFSLSELPTEGMMHATLDWVIVGGESGPDARPMHPNWARSLRDQCAAAGVAYFFKQWGSHSLHEIDEAGAASPPIPLSRDFKHLKRFDGIGFREPLEDETVASFWRRGVIAAPARKADAGAMLDGREHKEFPA